MQKDENTKKMFGIYALYFVTMLIPSANCALQNLAEVYPDIPFTTITLVTTLPALLAVPANIICGLIAGSKVKYKPLAIFSVALLIVSGVAPFFLHNFYAMLIARCAFGVASGLAAPLGSSIATRTFSGARQAKVVGNGTMLMSAGSIVFQMLAGFLCAKDTRYTWLAYLAVSASLLLVLICLSEPISLNEDENKVTETSTEKLPLSAYGSAFGYCLLMAFGYPFLLNASTLIIDGNLGTAASAGTILSLYTVGGMVAGIIFTQVLKVLNKHFLPICVLLCAISYIFVLMANNLVIMGIGSFINGLGVMLVYPGVIVEYGETCPPSKVSFAISLLVAGCNLGIAISTPLISLLIKATGNTEPKFQILAGTVGTVVLAIVWWITKLSKKSTVEK